MDREDGIEFIDDIINGGSPEKYFLSAIPYPAFLTVDADLYLLPDLLATMDTESAQSVAVLCHLQSDHARPVVLSLTEEERAAVVGFIDTLASTEEAAWMAESLRELKELIQGGPNQTAYPTTL